MPFLSEEIWQTLPHEGETIVTQPYPAPQTHWHEPSTEETFRLFEQSISLIRTARVLLNYSPRKRSKRLCDHEEPAASATLVRLTGPRRILTRRILAVPISQWPTSNILRSSQAAVTVGMSVEV